MAHVFALVTAAIGILFAPANANAAPTSPLCESGTYARAHPLICDTGGPLPNPGAPAGGGGGGGLIGRIIDGIGGLLGGGGLI